MSRLRELLDELRARQAAELRAADADDRERWSGEGGSPAPTSGATPVVERPARGSAANDSGGA